jgi:hypothetical protein
MNKKQYIAVDNTEGMCHYIIFFSFVLFISLGARRNVKAKLHYDVDPHKQRVAQTNMLYLIGLPETIAH